MQLMANEQQRRYMRTKAPNLPSAGPSDAVVVGSGCVVGVEVAGYGVVDAEIG